MCGLVLLALGPNSPQEIFDNDHRVVSQRGSSSGKFTFTAAEAGDHKICFTPSSSSGRSNWLSLSSPNGGIKLTLDMAIGETSAIESSDKSKLEDIATRVKDLNNRLNDIRREQVFQRVRNFPCRRRGGGKKKGSQYTKEVDWVRPDYAHVFPFFTPTPELFICFPPFLSL